MPIQDTGSYLCFQYSKPLSKKINTMKPFFNFSNTLAGITGRMLLTAYKLYMRFFAQRNRYTAMTSHPPVEREIILVKRRYTNISYTLN